MDNLIFNHNGYKPTKYDDVEIMNQLAGNLKGYDCPKCRNKGVIYFRDLKTDEILYRKCDCMKKRKTYYKLQQSGIEQMFDKYTFDNFETPNSYQKAMKTLALQYIQNINHQVTKRFFFIGGQSGAGKTHICTAIIGKLILMGRSGRYMLWRDESAELKAIANQPEYSARVKDLKLTDVLYIDDLFKTQNGKSPTTGDIHLAFEIINHRYNNWAPTIITSEWTLTELIAFDQAIGGRIKELSSGYAINIAKDDNKNYRLQ